MALRQLSKLLFPGLERDISHSVGKEVASMDEFMMLAPRVFSYEKTQGPIGGAFARTSARQAPAASTCKFVRVEYPVTSRGLFQE